MVLSDDDPFFLDPEKEEHSVKFEQSRKQMEHLMRSKGDDRLAMEGNASGFRPYENQSFIGEDEEMMDFRPSVTSVSVCDITHWNVLYLLNWSLVAVCVCDL